MLFSVPRLMGRRVGFCLTFSDGKWDGYYTTCIHCLTEKYYLKGMSVVWPRVGYTRLPGDWIMAPAACFLRCSRDFGVGFTGLLWADLISFFVKGSVGIVLFFFFNWWGSEFGTVSSQEKVYLGRGRHARTRKCDVDMCTRRHCCFTYVHGWTSLLHRRFFRSNI